MAGSGPTNRIASGTRLGNYEVLGGLGAGGMGEVYRARDLRLGREVALKFLSPALSGDQDALARFEREARVLASLNHPNVAIIHGLEQADGARFLVLEYVPGETLEARLAGGALEVRTGLQVARQIAEALEAAHNSGVVHRDLKPANVKLTPAGVVKVLDFGLAKPVVGGTDSTSTPTTSLSATKAGSVLGSPGYMSPEQARGQTVDKRADLWALGCILFEMLSGTRAFPGNTAADAMAAILGREPDWARLPASLPAEIGQLLHRCLEKDPARRMRDAGDARLEIEQALAGTGTRPSTFRGAAVALLALAVIAAVTVISLRRERPAASRHPATLAQVTFAEGIEEQPAWSPDGQELLYVASPPGGRLRKVFRKNLTTGSEAQLTKGEGDDLQPAWSPDGKRILFVRAQQPDAKLQPGDVFGEYDGADVWSLDLATGAERRLIQNAFNPAFSPDGKRIAVDASWAGPRRIWLVDADGHNPQQVSTDTTEAMVHVAPRWSPDGKRIVFQNIERTKFDIRMLDLDSKTAYWITNDLSLNIQPVFSPSGKFIYFTSYRSGGMNIWRMPVSAEGTPAGPLEQVTTGAGQDLEAAISPDGRQLAFATLKQNADIWKLPVSPQTGMPTGEPRAVIATTREDSRGAWSRDGRDIAFNSDRGGDMNIWLYSDRDGSVRQLTKGPGGDFQPNWSPDTKQIVFFSSRSGNPSIWQVDVGSAALRQLTHTRSIDINPFYSPDGRWIAFQSDRSGRLEVWVMAADGSGPRQLSHEGVSGHFLRWNDAGDAVIFRCLTCAAAPTTAEIAIQGGAPRELVASKGGAHISLSPDRSRIMDVIGHRTMWVSPIHSGEPQKVYEFSDPSVRIDYPVWSPDGKWVLFDRYSPQGGDIWVLKDFE